MTEPPRAAAAAPLPAGRIRYAGLAILAALAAALWWAPPWLTRFQASGFDAFQALAPRQIDTLPVQIVEVDERSITARGQWPWPRTMLAELIRDIARGNPAAIGIDILMPEADRLSPGRALEQVGASDPELAARIAVLPGNDGELARAMGAVPVVLALAGTRDPTRGPLRATPVMVRGAATASGADAAAPALERYAGVLGNVDEIDRAAAGRGLISAPSTNGVVRRVPLVFDVNGTLVPGFAMEMLRVAQGAPAIVVATAGGDVRTVGAGRLALPVERDGAMRVYFSPRDEQRYVAAVDVLDGRVDPQRFRNAIVLIGVTGIGITDKQNTPIAEPMPGTEIQAQLIENVLDGTWLKRPAWARALELAVFLALGGLLVWATPRVAPRNAGALAAACVAVPLFGAYVAFRIGRWLFDAATPGLALTMLFLLLLFQSLREATRHRKALERVLQDSREQAARVAGEFAAARRIQTGLLPSPTLVRDDPRVDLAASMTPAREVGGDLYDYFMLDTRRLFFIVGDVAGKGLSASIFMAVSKALYKSMALRAPDSDAGALMTAANVEVSRDNPETLFVTAFAGILDLETGELAYCNAGHENPYVLSRATGAMTRVTDGDGPPLCAIDDYAYAGSECRLAAGDVVCVVTDGVNDAQSPAGDLYGAKRVESMLAKRAQSALAPATLVDAVRAGVAEFTAGAEPADDLTVLAVRWNGPGRGSVAG